MTDDHINVTPEVLRQAADGHTAAADYLSTVPDSNEAILSSLESLGPVYAELREEGRLKLEERRRSYEAQAAEHRNTAESLGTANTMWENQESESVSAFRQVTGEA